jgi:hypothetical protein
MADNHEASSSSTDKYSQPRWCPPGLTHTQKRRLQRLRCQEQKEQEAERLRDEQLNKYKPIFPQSKVWRVKSANQPAGPVEPPLQTDLTGIANRSDRLEQPVRLVEPSVQQKAESATPISVPCDEGTPLAPLVQDDEELVDYEATPRTRQHGAQRGFSARGAENRRMVTYLMKFLFSKSVCKGISKL